MKLRSALIALAAGALSLALVAPAAAAISSANDLGQQPIAPAGPGDNGKPEDPGRPENPGPPDGVGPSSHEPPELPDNASPRAHAAVTAAYERFTLISARIDAIRALEAGPGRSDALNELFAEFGDLIHTVSDAVHEVDPEDAGGNASGSAGASLTSEGDEDPGGDDGDKGDDEDAGDDEDDDDDKDEDDTDDEDDED